MGTCHEKATACPHSTLRTLTVRPRREVPRNDPLPHLPRIVPPPRSTPPISPHHPNCRAILLKPSLKRSGSADLKGSRGTRQEANSGKPQAPSSSSSMGRLSMASVYHFSKGHIPLFFARWVRVLLYIRIWGAHIGPDTKQYESVEGSDSNAAGQINAFKSTHSYMYHLLTC
jgi:hypothetical protein